MTTKENIQPKVSIVGAGPGDPDQLTAKAIRLISSADVILYDALVGKEVLSFAPIDIPKIYVGKRKSNHKYSQDQINQLIVDFAYTYGHAVRLKGGDPFVFGRGGEELKYAESFNIETDIAPGISSSLGVPGLQGIPLTHRGISEGFQVVTATTRTGALSKEIYHSAKGNSTTVVLMGVDKLDQIVSVYQNAGKGSLPVAILQDGSLPTENLALGRVDNILKIAHEEKIKSPAVIVIGEVVKLHRHYPIDEVAQFETPVKESTFGVDLSFNPIILN